ncbi:sigma-70 family RNA polymerase sigma factor [Polyangium mundeleinium]|uniref:Sigma-70 family RNA polymerase sigma factor n=1 Tax=Polyangium mundeleinium TaxID=2995306 RepID=A0ABT5F362_9BACT|nr:sigma-70 family RNA polymerase sigma factor [Polyangium mundeleinium]MDC0748535.1 sigma-70 family RNA polymerase sigma factor [Polyangium mundeleinium]
MPPIPTPPDESLRPEPADPTDDQTEGALGLPDDLPDAPPLPEAAIGRLGRVNRSSQEASNKEARRREAEEDRELILRAQKGDQAAFRRLVERHQRRAFAIAMGLVRDENDARELVQDAFLRVYRNLNSFQGGSSFFTWLYRIVTNLAIDLMRKPGRRDAELVDGQAASEEPTEFPLVSRIDGADPIDVMRRREIASRIQDALDALPPYHRGVILMREVEGMSYEEMAVAMGVSKGTIMSRLFHARQKLQRALADCYAEEGRSRSGHTDEIPAEPEEAP